jgi:hypothetical protein
VLLDERTTLTAAVGLVALVLAAAAAASAVLQSGRAPDRIREIHSHPGRL